VLGAVFAFGPHQLCRLFVPFFRQLTCLFTYNGCAATVRCMHG